jgi:hypothetical protein
LAIFTNYVLFCFRPNSKIASVPSLHTSFSWLLGKAIKERAPYMELPTSNATPWRPDSPRNLPRSANWA